MGGKELERQPAAKGVKRYFSCITAVFALNKGIKFLYYLFLRILCSEATKATVGAARVIAEESVFTR